MSYIFDTNMFTQGGVDILFALWYNISESKQSAY